MRVRRAHAIFPGDQIHLDDETLLVTRRHIKTDPVSGAKTVTFYFDESEHVPHVVAPVDLVWYVGQRHQTDPPPPVTGGDHEQPLKNQENWAPHPGVPHDYTSVGATLDLDRGAPMVYCTLCGETGWVVKEKP